MYRLDGDLSRDFSVSAHFDLRDDANCHVTLHYDSRERDHPTPVKLKVRLAWVTPRYGGRRWYFICPATKKRVTALYLPEGSRDFLSREGWSFAYRTQREPKWKHKFSAAERAHRILRGNGNWRHYVPPRPPSMKMKTYA